MKKDIIERLWALTEEEREIIGGGKINTDVYFSGAGATIRDAGLFDGSSEIGIRRHTRFADFPLHKHSYLEVMTVLNGSVTHRVNGTDVKLDAGDILFMNKHTEHSVGITGVGDIAVNISLSDSFVSSVFADLGGTSFFSILSENAKPGGNGCYLHFSTAGVTAVENLIENIIIELLDGGGDAIASKYVEILLRYLSRESDKLLVGGDAPQDKRSVRMRAITEYISSSYMTATLAELSHRLYLCTPYLSKSIKEYFGKSFTELVVDEKMRRAEALVVRTDMNIGDIISTVGYENESYFHKEFRKRYGCTPLALRKNMSKNADFDNQYCHITTVTSHNT